MKFVDEVPPSGRWRASCCRPSSIWPASCGRQMHFKFMEVCGHTHTIYRARHRRISAARQRRSSADGLGRPVCVIPMVIDRRDVAGRPTRRALRPARGHDVAARLNGSPLDAKARGRRRAVRRLAPDALKIAVDNRDKQVVFFVIGFETTAPSTAVTLCGRGILGLPNFSVFCNHVTIVPPIKAILESPDLRLSGFHRTRVTFDWVVGLLVCSRRFIESHRWWPVRAVDILAWSRCCCVRSARDAAKWRISTSAWSPSTATRRRWR